LVPTPAGSASPTRWHRYLSVVSALLLQIVVAPVVALVVMRSTGLRSELTPYAVLAVLLAAAFTLRRSWGANGFLGGLKLWRWWALWPVWVVAAPLLVLSAASRSPTDHLQWMLLSVLAGFVEEAFFRGVILRALLPGGARSAIVWSAVWFGAAHLLALAGGYDWRMVLLLAAGAFGVGLVFAWVRIASASIWPVVIAHAFFDYTTFVDNGGLRVGLKYTTYNIVTAGLVAVLTLGWAWWLLIGKSPLSRIAGEGGPS
jgi:membrane protease YdiL (CAAX protease family)